MHRRALLAAVAALPLCVAACSKETTTQDPASALAQAKTTLEAAKAVTLDLSSAQPIPSGNSGVSAAKGTGLIDATTPKFSGEVTAVVAGAPVSSKVVAIGPDTWLNLFGAGLRKVDVASLGAPNPSSFFAPGTGLSSMLSSVQNPAGGSEKRYGKEVLTSYTGTVPGSVVRSLLRLGPEDASYAAEFGIAKDTHQLRTAKLTGPFYNNGDTTYSITLTDYGKTVDITAPE